jgi:hypothetical protein
MDTGEPFDVSGNPAHPGENGNRVDICRRCLPEIARGTGNRSELVALRRLEGGGIRYAVVTGAEGQHSLIFTARCYCPLIPYRGTTFAIDGRPGHRVEFGSSTGGVIDRLILREPPRALRFELAERQR